MNSRDGQPRRPGTPTAGAGHTPDPAPAVRGEHIATPDQIDLLQTLTDVNKLIVDIAPRIVLERIADEDWMRLGDWLAGAALLVRRQVADAAIVIDGGL